MTKSRPVLRTRANRDILQEAYFDTFVLVGIGDHPSEEIWTRSRVFLRAIRASLEGWWEVYFCTDGERQDREFLETTRVEWKLCDAINRGHNRCVFSDSDYNEDRSQGVITYRIFKHLVQQKVLKHPRAASFRQVTSVDTYRSAVDDAVMKRRPVKRDGVWEVDGVAADSWLATRLLLLEDKP